MIEIGDVVENTKQPIEWRGVHKFQRGQIRKIYSDSQYVQVIQFPQDGAREMYADWHKDDIRRIE